MSLEALGSLEIHILGPADGVGESIVIRTPRGDWGAIDSYNKSPGDHTKNPTLRFLKERGVTRLKFVALTHPHADHSQGILDLLNALEVDEFWLFASETPHELWVQWEGKKPAQFREEILREKDSLIVQLYEKIYERRSGKQLSRKIVSLDCRLLDEENGDLSIPKFEIWGLAPSGDQKVRYGRALKACFEEDNQGRPLLKRPDQITAPDANLISSAFRVSFGGFQAILGGDVLEEGWSDLLNQGTQRELHASIVKTAHHGSTNGYCSGLWERFSGKGKPAAVITPFAPQRLPRREGLKHISTFASKIDVTSLAALRVNLGPVPRRLGGKELRAEMLLRNQFGAKRRTTSEEYGRCSFVVDSSGAVAEELHPPAGAIQNLQALAV